MPQLIENIASLKLELSPDELKKLDEVGERLKQLTAAMSKKSMTDWWPDRFKTASPKNDV